MSNFISGLAADEQISKRPKIGLVLSGGGARGVAHIGVLKVLEELGIEPDFITGTSMGSIVGGLYAIGYNAEQLEEIMLNQDWQYMLMDDVLLSDVSFEEKDSIQRYIGELPIEDFWIKMPAGMVGGQHISKLLADLTISAQQITDFNQLRIPFRCIATDISTGDPVVLDHGFLPEAMRTSMSIPSAFTPVKKDGKVYIDGGLARNLPVQDVIEMGADIVIAVDVSSKLYESEQLDSFVKIMEQSINLRGVERSKEQQKLADILILPDVSDISILAFDNLEYLIAKGEEDARENYSELELIANEQNLYERPDRGIPILKVDNLKINKINVQGLETVSKNLIIGKLHISENSVITFKELSDAIDRLYGSRYFERVTYRLSPSEKGVDLEVIVLEKANHNLNFSFSFDSETEAAVLLNDTIRNLLIEGSRLSFDIQFNENPAVRTSYFIHLGWKPGFGFGIENSYERYRMDYQLDHRLLHYKIDKGYSKIKFQTVFVNDAVLGVYGKYELNNLESSDELNPVTVEIDNMITCGFFKLNSLNRKYFPTKGLNLSLTFEYFSHNKSKNYLNQSEPFIRLQLKSDKYFQWNGKLSMNNNFEAGYILGNKKNIPQIHDFVVGGENRYEENFIPFNGWDMNQKFFHSFIAFRFNLQYNIWRELFISSGVELIDHGYDIKEQLELINIVYGGDLELGVRLPFGLVRYSVSMNTDLEKVKHYLEIGHRF